MTELAVNDTELDAQAEALRRVLSDLRLLDSREDLKLVVDYASARLGVEGAREARERLDYQRLLERLAAVELGELDPVCVEVSQPFKDRSLSLIAYALGAGWACEVVRRSGAWMGGVWRLEGFTTPERARYALGEPGSEVEHLLEPHKAAVRAYTTRRPGVWPMVPSASQDSA